MILVIDNYDSFTYNLVQILSTLDEDVRVVRNDTLSVDAVLASKPDRLVVSPGPGRPEDAGITCELVRRNETIPLLGVCLGHQALGAVFGGTISRAPVLMHGKTSEITHDGRGLFEGLPNPFTATRYHSLVVEKDSVPGALRITATSSDGLVMGLAHRTLPLVGVQFHPESILTPQGERLLKNFVAGRLA
jgi:anthranilate synthase/aminodeoxychorismate synthase-like glutamine amidotransferase